MTGQEVSSVRVLGQLLEGVTEITNAQDLEVYSLTLDSRSVSPGSMFVGLPGAREDGRRYIEQAVQAGASAVLYESRGWSVRDYAVPSFPVEDLRKQSGLIASRFYGRPSRPLCVIGFTGTNGKTTCAGLLAQALKHLGRRSAFIGTVGAGLIDDLQSQSLTTPDVISLHAHLARLLDQGADSVCLEVSSHALDQGRVDGIEFDTAVFTNLSRDHLDYHASIDDYAATKLLLFRSGGLRTAVINSDDPWGAEFALAGLSANVWTYGTNAHADVYLRGATALPDGYRLQLSSPLGIVDFQTSLLGQFNVVNTIAVVGTLLALDYSPDQIEQVMPFLRPMRGRMELVEHQKAAPKTIVDFAHTPAALEQVLTASRCHAAGDLWCVFGCGGDRDAGKRPLMGAVAQRLADHVVLTSDNPRGESPWQILDQIQSGMSTPPRTVVVDRKEAIRFALNNASDSDLVLIAGKGHETEQVTGPTAEPFSDQDTIRQLLEEHG